MYAIPENVDKEIQYYMDYFLSPRIYTTVVSNVTEKFKKYFDLQYNYLTTNKFNFQLFV